ncbi:predicted protein [Histoplasma mississippiense (nom. inval.)]|uniref:predicted protein n=1 Tax=Ajellomyces capsulatus (strain NAm1 / WU24) TaxID=2059318 RepID=UPI000157D3A6|nr:predicted protein [Histoplasma mississippiense (nom. inval.)]EDN04804.1 predicted protein [Histoplasma mississippiense (nom. inval.)]
MSDTILEYRQPHVSSLNMDVNYLQIAIMQNCVAMHVEQSDWYMELSGHPSYFVPNAVVSKNI